MKIKYKNKNIKIKGASFLTVLGVIIIIVVCVIKFNILKDWWFWVGLVIGLLLIFNKYLKKIILTLKYFLIEEIEIIKTVPDQKFIGEKEKLKIYEEKPKENIEEDEFGVHHLVEEIKELIITQPEDKRLIIGIDGKIGMGKTTLMNFIRNRIERKNKDQFLIGQVNTWLYKDERSLLEGVFSSILYKNEFLSEKLKEFLKSIIEVYFHLPIGVGIHFKKDSSQSFEEIKKKFENEIDKIPYRIIIFLDDLDRCDKEEILFTFKLLREFLYIKKFIFIVGYDKEILKSKVDIDIEKFVDLEISLKIEQNDIINWFYKKLKEHFPYEEIKDIYENETIKNDFESILNEYMDTPRKAKQILNELITLYPLVKNEVYFPHFAITTILRRDIPSLYYYLQEGGFWILQKGAFDKYQKELFEKEIENIVHFISKKENKEDLREFKRKIYNYLDILSSDISWKEIANTGEIKPSKKIEDKDWVTQLARSHEKTISNKFYTEKYFLFKIPSYSYSDNQFEILVSTVKDEKLKDEDKIDRIRREAEGTIEEGKFESFLELIERESGRIWDLRLNSIFMFGLARLEKYPYDLHNKLGKLMINFIPIEPIEELESKSKRVIENIRNPALLSIFQSPFIGLDIKIKIKYEKNAEEIIRNYKNSLLPYINSKFEELLAKHVKCPFCDYNIPWDKLFFFQLWEAPETIAKYIKDLERKHKKECARLIIKYMDDLKDHIELYQKILEIYNSLNSNN